MDISPTGVRRYLEHSRATTYAGRPVEYAREVLGVEWWAKQREIAELAETKRRVLVKACHKVGKTHFMGGYVNYWYDSYDPGMVLSTATTKDQVTDALWKEVRTQRGNRPGFTGPKAARLQSRADHFAIGYTAKSGTAFHGRHSPHTLLLFDEAVGVESQFWEAAESMFNDSSVWIAIYNPTDTTSQAYTEELSGKWHIISLSALEHPNIAAQLRGEPPPFPSAIQIGMLDTLLSKWCRPVVGERTVNDIQWPPEGGSEWFCENFTPGVKREPVWLRPGPIAECRLLGRWPSQATSSVWSDGAWQASERQGAKPEGTRGGPIPEPTDQPVQIGCDVAWMGDDYTEFHVRRGPVSLHHEGANGLKTTETAGRLKQLCQQFGPRAHQDARDVLCTIDTAGGWGAGVMDNADGYRFVGINCATIGREPDAYPNLRSELWFALARRAEADRLDLSRLDADTRRELRRQALGVQWSVDAPGRQVVERKEKTKARLQRSPDGMDAMNLAYYDAGRGTAEALPSKRGKERRRGLGG